MIATSGGCAGLAHSPATTHAAAANVRVYFLTVHRMSLLVSDQYWIAEAETNDCTGSIRSDLISAGLFDPLIHPNVLLWNNWWK